MVKDIASLALVTVHLALADYAKSIQAKVAKTEDETLRGRQEDIAYGYVLAVNHFRDLAKELIADDELMGEFARVFGDTSESAKAPEVGGYL